MYEKVQPNLDFKTREEEILKFWEDARVFDAVNALRADAPVFTFYDGPPTANGKPHIGHVLTRAYKDIIPRYYTMKGFNVARKAGWDTHGLPVELEVERQLGLDGKPQIEEYGIERFIEECKKSVWQYKSVWEDLSRRVGYWADMENPYVTYDNNYIESVWWSLKQIWDKGLLYKGHKVVPFCPRCGTALSSHEVAQGYKDVTEDTIIAKFRLKNEDGYILAWTTTPWTLPSNVALCVNAHETYCVAICKGERYILAQQLCENVFGTEPFTIEKTCLGADLAGTQYLPLFNFAAEENAFFVVCDDYVTLTEGTGIVHIAPAFGEDDSRVGRDNNLPFVQLVGPQGTFTEEAGFLAGMNVKAADPIIIADLEKRGLLQKVIAHTHSYPFCWRCDTPLIYYARSSWFIAMTKVRDELMANNRTVNWIPPTIKEGRMGNFIENVIDWGISRERYWGTPLPIWECECGHRHAIGSIAELKQMGIDVPEDIELHKPYIDAVFLKCEKCGGAMRRVPEVIDCWYDSGSMPFAQHHYPFENEDLFESVYPADFICEAIDQTRGWFYTLLSISTLLFNRSPFKNCIVLGFVNDKDGIKMSKHKNNVVDPWEAIERHGADAVRWHFYTSAAPWIGNRFSFDAVAEQQRKFMGTLWNTYAFFVLYANIDGFDPKVHTAPQSARTHLDRWLDSKLNSLVKFVTASLDAYKVTEAGRTIEDFTDELSNWYLRRNRTRYWAHGMEADKCAAYQTLYNALVTIAKLIAPFTPFLAETLYRNLVCSVDESAPKSVHLCDYPVADESAIDEEMDKYMDEVQRIVAVARAARNAASLKIRQPVRTLYVQGSTVPPLYANIIADELNVKEVLFDFDASAFLTYSLKSQLRSVGRKFGKLVPAMGKALAELDGNEAMDALNSAGLTLVLEGETVVLQLEDVLYERTQKPGYVAETDKEITCVLDTFLSPELIAEGYMREMVSKIQTMRREAGFEVTDHITVTVQTTPELQQAIEQMGDLIAGEVLADGLALAEPTGYVKQWDINGQSATIGVQKCE